MVGRLIIKHNINKGRWTTGKLIKILKIKSSEASTVVFEEVSSCGIGLSSSFQKFRHPCFVGRPFTYSCKDYSSLCSIDYTFHVGGIISSKKSTCHCLPLLLSRVNDHFPILIKFVVAPGSSTHTPVNRRACDCDVNLIGKPDCDSVFLECMSSFGGVPLMVDTSSHRHVIEEHVRDALCCAYPKVNKRKKSEHSEHISDVTHGYIVQKKEVSKGYQKLYNSYL